MKLISNLLQQTLLLVLLVGGGFFAYFNRESVTINVPYMSSIELPLWLICFSCAFIGFLACFIIIRSTSLANFSVSSGKKTPSEK
jgi:uncharacterized integral membrane protein